MKRHLMSNEKGSSSVLVVLTLLMLVLFGVLGMMSSFSEYKIAQKNAAWTQEYYAFEALANGQLEIMDTEISIKKKEAKVIFDLWKTGKSYADQVSEPIAKILESKHKGIGEKELTERLVYSVLMKAWLEDYGTEPIVQWGMDNGNLTLLYTVTLEMDSGRRYIVQVDLLPENKTPYQVMMWREIPKTFDYSEGIEFEDVEVIGS
jgi:hypothetical protein